MPSVILVAGARTLEICAVTFSHTVVLHTFVQLFQSVITIGSVTIAQVPVCSTVHDADIPFLRLSVLQCQIGELIEANCFC